MNDLCDTRPMKPTCSDDKGTLVPAFSTTENYVRCTRCGHVYPNPKG